MFDGKGPDSYKLFRNTWILFRRQRPVIPCPQQCPLPSFRMSKERRVKILSVYHRPCTWSTQQACEDVPYMTDLHVIIDGRYHAKVVEPNLRQAWKHYLGRVWPHAAR